MILKPGVVIEYKKKKYRGEIPDKIFDSIYGKDADRMRGKFELVPERGTEKAGKK